ncbi:hypothetical protein GQ457_01G011660 [Hibiscus cannabinus]
MAEQQRKTEMESAAEVSKELKRKKRMKLLVYALAFAIFQTIVILVFSLTVMRIKNPKFRVLSITVEDLQAVTTNLPYFNIKLKAQVAVKNTNFGHFKFQNTTISFDYGGAGVGDAFVAKGRSKARSTKKMNVAVELNSNNIPNNSSLQREIESGYLALTCHSKLSGKVQLMKLIKKKKSAEMRCAMLLITSFKNKSSSAWSSSPNQQIEQLKRKHSKPHIEEALKRKHSKPHIEEALKRKHSKPHIEEALKRKINLLSASLEETIKTKSVADEIAPSISYLKECCRGSTAYKRTAGVCCIRKEDQCQKECRYFVYYKLSHPILISYNLDHRLKPWLLVIEILQTMADQQRKTEMESAAEVSKELKRKKRMKLLVYAIAFAIFQTIVILVFSLTVMRIKNPKFRVPSITVEDLRAAATNPPSFNIKLNAQVAVKNTNFGHFKFENTTISFDYGGVGVGDALVARGRSKARSTKKINVNVELNSNNIPNNSSLQREIESGYLALTCHSKLSGKVQLMKLIKKKKSAEMRCAMLVNLLTKAVQDIKCQ